MDNEKAWIQRALTGDQRAFSHLVDAYQVPIYNLAYRMLGDSAEAEDAAQETFLRAWTRLRTYDVERKFSSWVLSIASHYCIDRLRRRRTTQVSLEDILAQQAFSDPHDGPEKVALNHEMQERIGDLMESLPTQYRAVLALRYWQELSYVEMAEVLGTSQSAIKSRLHRARCMLAERMQPSETRAQSLAASPKAAAVPVGVVDSSPTQTRKWEAVQHALSAIH